MDQNLTPSGSASYNSTSRNPESSTRPSRDDGMADLNTAFFANQIRGRENPPSGPSESPSNGGTFSLNGWRAAVLALGGLVTGGTAEAAMQQDAARAIQQGPPASVAKLNAPRLTDNPNPDRETIQHMEQMILDSLNPETSKWQRQRAELELARQDPGAKKLLPIAWRALESLPAEAPAWKREALELFIMTRQLNIEFANRMPLDMIREICQNRINQVPDGRPLAISICTKGDHNGAFYLGDNMYPEMKEAGYRILYFEAESDTQFIEALFTGTMLGTSREQKANLIIIGGHGSRTSLVFERGWGDQPDNHGEIDFSDQKRFEELGIKNTLAAGGQIVLDSCSNGSGRAEMDNIANLMRRVFPHAKKEGIWSATESYGPISLKFDKNGELENVQYPVPEYRAFQNGNGNGNTPVSRRTSDDADIRA